MDFVADEHVHSAVINALRSKGYDVVRSQDEYGEGVDDPELLEKTAEDDRVLLTNDRDFVGYADEVNHAGVIIYTDQKRPPREVLRAIIRVEDAYSGDLQNRKIWLQGWA